MRRIPSGPGRWHTSFDLRRPFNFPGGGLSGQDIFIAGIGHKNTGRLGTLYE